MNAHKFQENQSSRAVDVPGGASIVDLVAALRKRKAIIFGLPLVLAVSVALYALTLPNIYNASTKILPHQPSQSNAAAVLNQAGNLAGAPAGGLSVQIPIGPNTRIPLDLYVSLLKSRSVADNLIQRFDLKKVYNIASLELARNVLARNSAIRLGKDGLIEIEVEDSQPKRAAEIANAYVEELLQLTKTLAFTETSQHRLFLGRQLRTTSDKLAQAKEALKALPSAGNATSARISALVEAAARLRAQISAKEIQLTAMQSFATADTQEYRRDQDDLARMRAELLKLRSGPGGPAVVGVEREADKQGETSAMKVLEDVSYYDALHKLLEKMHESARAGEADDSSLIQVLDKAVEPETKSRPNRASLTFTAGLAGLFIGCLWVLLFDVLQLRQVLQGRNNGKPVEPSSL